jgi:hypothetical protein
VATDGVVGSSASGPSFQGRSREPKTADVLGELWPVVVLINGLGGRQAFDGPESVERPDKFLWLGQDGDGIRLEAGADEPRDHRWNTR